jgi:hypothetical protein
MGNHSSAELLRFLDAMASPAYRYVMRLTALLAASVLAAGAWIACWQQVQLVRLKHQIHAAAAVSEAARPNEILSDRARSEPARPENPPHPLDRLQTLLAERQRAVADARDAAAQFGIPAGPEMDQAIAFSTADLDQAIAKLIGPAAVAQLAVVTTPSVPVAPAVPAPVAPAPIYVTVQPAQVYFTVAAPAPVVVAAAAPAPDESETEAQPAAYPVATFGFGSSYVTTGRSERHKPTQAEQLKYFTASAGIPLAASPLAAVATTSPLLLLRQHLGGR